MGKGQTSEPGAKAAVALMIIAVVVLSGTAAGLVAVRGADLRRYDNEREKGEYALDFTVVSIDGVVFNLSDFKGRPVLLDLMTTWCGICRNQMPMMNRTYNDNKDSLVFISIGMDWFETDDDLRQFRDDYGAKWPFALDRTASVYGAFYAQGYPTLIIIDKEGRIVFSHAGAITQKDLGDAVALVV